MSDRDLPHSIPTDYRGIRFRSRFEADVAWNLDQMGVAWQYEPRSFLLPSGVHFMPDFYLPAEKWWLEARGYRTDRGEQQLREFPAVLPEDEALLVVRPGWESEFHFSHAWKRAFWSEIRDRVVRGAEDQLDVSEIERFIELYREPQFTPGGR